MHPRSPAKTRAALTKQIEELRTEADEINALTRTATGVARDAGLTRAASKRGEATAIEKKMAKWGPPVRVLDAETHPSDVRTARQYQAVQHGEQVYLPYRETASGTSAPMPNPLIRSALFVADAVDRNSPTRARRYLRNAPIAAWPGTTIRFTGEQLDRIDERVYAACVRAYRDQPLPKNPHSRNDFQTTFWKFIVNYMHTSYSLETHFAVRDSLERFSWAKMRVEHHGINMSAPELLRVDYQDGLLNIDRSTIPPSTNAKAYTEFLQRVFHGSDYLAFSIPSDMSEFFGPNEWTNVPFCEPKIRGLTHWLASFYATHKKPHPVKISVLHELSGSNEYQDRRRFRGSLVKSLDRLTQLDDGHPLRVASYKFAGVKKDETVEVQLARWPVQVTIDSQDGVDDADPGAIDALPYGGDGELEAV